MAARQKKAASVEIEQVPRWAVTTIRVKTEHLQALRMAALERATARGGGKVDASEVLREVLDAWMEKRGR